MKRSEMQAIVRRAVDELDDKSAYGDEEGRYLRVEGLLSAIDWGVVDVAVIREVFALLIRRLPVEVLTRGARDEAGGLIGCALRALASSQEIRAELAREDAARDSAAFDRRTA